MGTTYKKTVKTVRSLTLFYEHKTDLVMLIQAVDKNSFYIIVI